jgi:hypothetical protein
LLQRCREKIEREAVPKDRADLLAVSHVLAELKFPSSVLLSIFGGELPMIESPLLKRIMAQAIHAVILDLLKDRFESVPLDIRNPLEEVLDQKKLRKLNVFASKCRDLEAFRERLLK